MVGLGRIWSCYHFVMGLEFRHEKPKQPTPEMMPEKVEKIASAALKIKGELYEGPTHGDAWNSALMKHPEFDTGNDLEIDEGFLTSLGRFVTREEGKEIAEKSAQLRKPIHDGRNWLDSNDVVGLGDTSSHSSTL